MYLEIIYFVLFYILNKIIYQLKDWGFFQSLLSKCIDMLQSIHKIIVI